GLFAQRRNLVSPNFFRFLLEIARFCKNSREELAAGELEELTLGEYLQRGRYSPFMIDNYLVPMAAAIWSTPALKIFDFPAGPFLHFFRNHGLLSLRNRPSWRTVVGGSHSYVKAFAADFRGEIHLQAGVEAVERDSDHVRVHLADGEPKRFDQVVVATHADQALRLLRDPTDMEERLLSPWQYQLNRTVLHTDASVLPKERRAWSAWNFTREAGADEEQPVYVTYDMNRLQGLAAKQEYCVTLNRPTPCAVGSVIAEMDYHHPLYSFASMATQSQLSELNGRQRTWFCGSYFGYGFHEDAVRSGAAVAEALGVPL
ncbi:MAG: amine oxidase, partial [Desulfuromonas sp.]